MASSSGETMPEQQEKLAHQNQDEVHDAPDSRPQGKHPEAGTSTPSVRFSSAVQEISPPVDNAPNQEDQSLGQPGEATPEMLKALSKSLQGGFNNLQERRMNIFSFEPFSLPASRVPSNEDDSRNATREHTRSSGSGRPSPLLGPKNPDLHSPPLTPSGTEYLEGDSKRLSHSHVERATLSPHHDVITPQDSTAHDSSRLSTTKLAHRPASHEEVSKRPDSSDDREHTTQSDHRKGMFSLGPRDSGSLPVSREGSPSRSSAASQYTRPFTPSGDLNDPYAANKRMPQNQNKIEPRFVFNRKKKHSPSSSSTSLGKHSEKRHSALYNKKDELMQHETGSSAFGHHKQGSMADLKRFFKMGGHHKAKRAASPSASVRSGTRTPPSSKSAVQIPFGDDHGLSSKYGKLGKVLGSGAGGSVRLMKRSEDNTIFAVKEFRPRHSYETEKEYVKKLTAEYCMGSSLHHGNIIETLDIVQEKGKWYEVMEYAPYDLFAIVMTGKMSREEVACCFLQILSGVTYLHSMGLAHRDLKLDNVVVSDRGIIKIIDFGSAHVFKYPFESGMVLASGIVGSDPYLAPEVYDERKYDPTAVDIWSLAIIYCCMTLRRFPWKVPRMTDNSFKLFAADPTPGHDPRRLVLPHAKSTNALYDTPGRDTHIHDPSRKGTRADVLKMQDVADNNLHKEGETRDAEKKDDSPEADKRASMDGAGEGDKKHNPATHEKKSDGTLAPPAEKKEVIRGPWRILRLLPRESRHVIGRMLQINPKERIRMPEILEDPWVANTVICRQIGPGVVINADDHTHILEPPSAAK